jgi:serine/threonine protein kinase
LSAITTALGTDVDQDRIKQVKKEFLSGTAVVESQELPIPEMSLIEAGIELQKELGHGNQSSVFAASKVIGRGFSCVKRFEKANSTPINLAFLRDEYKVMEKVGSHPRIAEAFQIFQDSSFFYIELALYRGGDFTSLRHNAVESGACCNEAWWKNIFRQTLQGLSHLHSHGFMHCDIKEPNLMLKTQNYDEPEVVLIDFGVAQAEGVQRIAIFGTPGYIAPEVWDTKVWTPKGDVFSFGVVMLQMMSDRVPREHGPRCGVFTENTKSYNDIKVATRTRVPDMSSMVACGTHLRRLTEKLLTKDSAQRPNASEALSFLE